MVSVDRTKCTCTEQQDTLPNCSSSEYEELLETLASQPKIRELMGALSSDEFTTKHAEQLGQELCDQAARELQNAAKAVVRESN